MNLQWIHRPCTIFSGDHFPQSSLTVHMASRHPQVSSLQYLSWKAIRMLTMDASMFLIRDTCGPPKQALTVFFGYGWSLLDHVTSDWISKFTIGRRWENLSKIHAELFWVILHTNKLSNPTAMKTLAKVTKLLLPLPIMQVFYLRNRKCSLGPSCTQSDFFMVGKWMASSWGNGFIEPQKVLKNCIQPGWHFFWGCKGKRKKKDGSVVRHDWVLNTWNSLFFQRPVDTFALSDAQKFPSHPMLRKGRDHAKSRMSWHSFKRLVCPTDGV